MLIIDNVSREIIKRINIFIHTYMKFIKKGFIRIFIQHSFKTFKGFGIEKEFMIMIMKLKIFIVNR